MNAELHHRLKNERKLLADAKEKHLQRMDLCRAQKSIHLKRNRRHNGNCYYYAKHPDSGGYVYLGKENHEEVRLIKEAHSVSEILKRIDRNIALIDSFLQDYQELDKAAIDAALPEAYRCGTDPISSFRHKAGEQWLVSSLAFQNSFPENYPHQKRHRASDGVMLKTLSELIIYERFKSEGLYTVYELPLVLNDYGPPMYPDFTVLSPVDNKSVILVEFVGRMDLTRYREDFARKVGRYIDNGYIPGVNLFFLYGKDDGTVDSTQIGKTIADIKGL